MKRRKLILVLSVLMFLSILISGRAEEKILGKVVITKIKPVSEKKLEVEGLLKAEKIYGTGKIKQKKISFNWHSIDKDGKAIKLEKPWSSHVEVSEEGLEDGDSFKVVEKQTEEFEKPEGKKDNNTEEAKTDSKDKGKRKRKYSSSANNGVSTTGSIGSSSTKAADSLSDVKATVKGEEIKTEEGCTPNIDYTANKVFIKKKTLVAGEEKSGCQDTTESYDIIKDYNSCKPEANFSSGKYYKQFKYKYIRDGKEIVIAGCSNDTSSVKNIESDYLVCADVHYKNEGYSLAARKKYYLSDTNKKQYLSNCEEDQNKKYAHQKSYDECTPVTEVGKVTPYYRTVYTKDGVKKFLSECLAGEAQVIDVEQEEGCTPRIDTATETIFIQKKKMKDGVEVQACQDSSETYSLTRDYAGCAKHTNFSEGRIYEQYRYKYTRSGQEIVIDLCHKDSARSKIITKDYAACSVKDFVAEGYSLAQERKYYLSDTNQKVFLTECTVDEASKYLHSTTYEGCTAVKIDSSVVPYKRKYYTKDGSRNYISNCEPEQSVSIEEELCSTKFEHDYSANISYYKKNYFFNRVDGQKVFLDECIKSSETVTHIKETTGCSVQNDDASKTYISSYKTYVLDEYNGNTKTLISNCTPSTTAQNYSSTGGKWIKSSTSRQGLRSSLPYKSYIGKRWKAISGTCTLQMYFDNQCIITDYNPTQSNLDASCKAALNSNAWYTSSQNPIYKQYSDEFPTVSAVYTTSAKTNIYKDIADNTITRFWKDDQQDFYLSCNNPACNVSLVKRYPLYIRGDKTQYLDSSTVLESRYVCGQGTLLVN